VNANFQRNLRRLNRLPAADRVDRALQRSCIGRLASVLTVAFILLCIDFWLAAFVVLTRFTATIRTILGVTLFGGFLLAIRARLNPHNHAPFPLLMQSAWSWPLWHRSSLNGVPSQ